MKAPTSEQQEQLRQLRNQQKVIEYLRAVEQDYLDKLVIEANDVVVRQIQGSLFVVRKLLHLISS